ncbi:hypothetical protein BLNAU_20918 [Blattamonas nauphoetae]|uniref:Protein kinase domain-containing protein n=1 Tax=Blattamonas nauphoetae TaxID=2049346 RepID=A0ABQ9X0L9_9EUKA|nr:hypothetical protein BLNAU_20918 [Blattamonas nauphoetae]
MEEQARQSLFGKTGKIVEKIWKHTELGQFNNFNGINLRRCIGSTLTKCTTTAIVKRDIILHKEFNAFFSDYYRTLRPEFRFEDTNFTGQAEHKFWSHNTYRYQFTRSPFTFFTTSASPIIFSHCSFHDLEQDPNDPFFEGGLAILIQTPAPVTITSCAFSDLTTYAVGAAIHISAATFSMMINVLIESSTFTHCSSCWGGALYDTVGGQVSIVSSSFIENRAFEYGGACVSFGCCYSFCRFDGNRASSVNAIYEEGPLSIRFCHFLNSVEGEDLYYSCHTEVVLGCTRSQDWREGSEVVVMGSGSGVECSASQPCNTLTEALNTASMNGKDVIHVGSGWTGSMTIGTLFSQLTLRGFYALEEASRSTHTPTSSFSITVEQNSFIALDSLSLSPANGLPLVKCELSGGGVQMTNLELANIEGITIPLFIFSEGGQRMIICHFENLSQITSALFSISGSAECMLETVLFRNIDSSSGVFVASSGGSIYFRDCLFHTITRTTGEGAAAIDMNGCNALEVTTCTFSHCHSKGGQAGALTIIRNDSFRHSISAFFVNNKGKTDTNAHDIFYAGFDPEVIPWSSSAISSFSDFPQVATDDDRTGTLPVISEPFILCEERVTSSTLLNQPALFITDLAFIDLEQSFPLMATIVITLDTKSEDPITLRPVRLSWATLTIKAPTMAFTPHVQQSTESQGSFFVVDDFSNLVLRYLYIIVTSDETEPLIQVEAQSSAQFEQCVITSDGSILHRPIVRSYGTLNLCSPTLFDFTLESHSCFECISGDVSITHSEYDSTSCASNITTTGDGAVLNADQCSVSLHTYVFFDCHSQNGGPVFCRACSDLETYHLHFVGCSATQNGGAMSLQLFLPAATISLGTNFYINCSAELGGALFINSSGLKSLSLTQPYAAPIIGVHLVFPVFSGCSASEGTGAYFDGDWSDMDVCGLSSLYMSNGGLPSTSQDLFFSATVADTMPAFDVFIQKLKDTSLSVSSRSTSDSGQYKHVEVGGESIASFNLERPKFILQSETFTDYCELKKETKCSSIHRLLDLFHTKDEDDEFVQIPVFLSNEISFVQTGRIRSQSVLFKTDTISNPLSPVKLANGPTFWEADSFFVRVEKDGTAELSFILFAWEADVGFCEVADEQASDLIPVIPVGSNVTKYLQYHFMPADESGRMTITSSIFDEKIDLTHSLVVCSAGTLVITQSTLTSTDSPILIKCPLVASSPLSSLFSNAATESLKVDMENVTFSDLKMGGSVDGVMHLDGPSYLHLKKMNFTNVLCESEEAVRIVVVGLDLERAIEYVPESEFPKRGTKMDELYKSLDLSEPLSSAYHSPTLLLYYHPITSTTIVVSSDGRDGFWCGDVSFPCLSLNEADAHLLPDYPSRIVVAKGAVLKSELDLRQDCTEIKAMGGEKSRVEVLRDGSLVNQADALTHSLTLDSLVFSVSAGRTTSLLVSRSGMLTLVSCSFVSSDSSTLTSKLVEVSGGSVKLTETDFTLVSFSTTLLSFSSFASVGLQNVSHRSCSSHTLMSFEGGSSTESAIEMRDCVFKGEPTPAPSSNEDDVICEWESGLIVVEKCSFEGFSSTFSHLSVGVLRVIDSSVSLKTSQFELNGPRVSSFPSLSWNIACTGSSVIELDSSSSDMATSHWISASESCVVKRSDESQISEPFFIPTLSLDNCSSTYSSKKKDYSVTISGRTLVPCGLSLIVFEVNNNSEGKSLPFALPSSFTTHHNETSISLEIPASSLKDLNTTFAWNVSLRFGNDGRTSSFRMKRTEKEIRAEAMGKTLPWLIPLIVSLSALLLVAIVVIVLCRRRRMKPSQNMSEMKEQEAIQYEDEKMEVEQETQQGVHVNDANDRISTLPNEEPTKPDNFPSSKFDPFEDVVEALHCGPRLEMRTVRAQDTLYNILHVFPEKKKTIVKSVIARQLALGLVKVAEASMNATVLTKLSSHWVMFDSNGSVCLKTRDTPPPNLPSIPLPNPNALQNEEQKEGNPQHVNHALEGQRWRAPEVAKAENETMTGNEEAVIDPRKAAVFSLGLVLWEIETGLVPFGEIDATNAQRQLGTGVLPKMDGVGSEMKDLICECLRLNPDDRPTLSDVSNCLISLATPKQTDGEEAHSDS